jgi:hypothetical protein
VDPASGSDDTGRGTPSSPFASLGRALEVCESCNHPSCGYCPVDLAPGVHPTGDVTIVYPAEVRGTGQLSGENPTVIEGTGSSHFLLWGATLENVKVTGFSGDIEQKGYTRLDDMHFVPRMQDVVVVGGD